jgi:hypothetical protein
LGNICEAIFMPSLCNPYARSHLLSLGRWVGFSFSVSLQGDREYAPIAIHTNN